MRSEIAKLPLGQVGFMDLVLAVQSQLKEPESIKMLEKMPQAQRDAALQVGVAALNYVEVVEGRAVASH